ncbi:PTS sugar transporter subunit IIA [Paucisalibacillus sp. EB02]|uniref:PTS sugar transporter subunit IIA n=1 Tax=Paucisalibacillus sp. EB02 TaxID=1347087 RepID=UPI0004B63D6F|nr:PTS sugar transporter subunit IIA [Paucisalibacillus sp. EB02]
MGIQEVLTEELICFDLKSNEKETAIRELADLMQKSKILEDEELYLEAVMKREAEFTTGIGYGVAIPHGKSNVVTKPSIAFGKSKSGISYDSMDGKPVHLIFLIAVPENSNNEHLKILSQLSRKLIHQDIRDSLMKAVTKDEIYEVLKGDE